MATDTTQKSLDAADLGAVTAKEASRLVALWLGGVAILVLAMVVVGGATRATGSGLSITEWAPITGAVPPLSRSAWEHAFALYRATPQYSLKNQGMSLYQFQFIFWWEWAHRLLGRLLGLAFLLPFLALVVARKLPRRLIWPCAGLFVLGALQGAVGWWMVKSGLENRASVAPERLAAHLGLALALFLALIWAALEALAGPMEKRSAPKGVWPRAALAFLGLVFAQCLLGAFAAGNHAGLIDSDWPLMGGRVVPDDYWRGDLWTSVAHNPSATQFDHRLGGYLVVAAAASIALASWRTTLRAPGLWLAGLSLAQASLGVTTLVLSVPLALALAHQTLAAALLGAATVFAWRCGRQPAVP